MTIAENKDIRKDFFEKFREKTNNYWLKRRRGVILVV